MTDLELTQLVRDSLPEELSFEQVEMLRRRMPHSAELRAALCEQLQLEQSLCGALGEVHVSLDWIFTQAAAASAAGGIAKLFGWGSTTALVVAVASVGVILQRPWAAGPKGAPPPVAQAVAINDLRAPRIDEIERPVAPVEELEAVSPSDAIVPPAAQMKPARAAERPALKQPLEPAAASELRLDGEDAGFFAELPGADFERLSARLQAIEGPHQPVIADGEHQPGILIGGLAKLHEAWPAGTALRVRPAGSQRFQMHFWKGVQGISLELFSEPQPGWAAYRTTRRASDLRPLTRSLVATDGQRYVRCGQGTIDFRMHEGRLLLARGDVPLLTIPYPMAPDAVVFDGTAEIQDLAIVPCKPLTWQQLPRANALEGNVPEQLTWLHELPPGAQWTFLVEGRGELLAEDTAGQAWAAVGIRDLGLREMVFELEDPMPGTGIYLGDERGRPLLQLGFFSDEVAGQTCFGWSQPGEMRTTARLQPGRGPAPWNDVRPWLRLVQGGGAWRCSISADGAHWSTPLEPLPLPQGGFSTAGLYALPGGGTRCVRVRRVEARRLSAIESLAPPSLRAQASGLDSVTNFAGWQQAVLERLPPGVDRESWRRACAVELLAAATRPDLTSAAVLDLLDSATADETLTAADRLKLLDEAALVFDASSPDAASAFVKHYERLGYALMREANLRPYSTVRRSLMTSPLWTTQPIDVLPASLVRCELSQLAGDGDDRLLGAFCRRLCYFAGAACTSESVVDGCDHQEVRQLIAPHQAATHEP